MHPSVYEFVRDVATPERITGKRVLEVGSYNVNGSARDLLERLTPCEYFGVDLHEQEKYVDEVLDATKLIERFGAESWDVVISNEMLEHAEHWKQTLDNIKAVLKPGGFLILTARGPGFPLHCHPHDYWRFTPEDIAAEMQDFAAVHISKDVHTHPGFLYAGYKKPIPFTAEPKPVMEAIEATDAQHPALTTSWEPEADPMAFYHVAAIGHWREIVSEQLTLFQRNGFTGKIQVGFVGPQHEDGFIRRVADVCNLDVDIHHFGSDLAQYEFPTLELMQRAARISPDRAMLYIHTKGCSKPYWVWTMWRWIMNSYAIHHWKSSAANLRRHNCAGFSWHASGFPVSYFPGNFWWARSSFIKQLTPIYQYVGEFADCISKKNPNGFTKRHAAECWINSRMNANPFIWGPEQSRLWDEQWWTGKGQEPYNREAYLRGR